MVTKNKYLTESGHLNDEYINLYIDAHLLDKVKELPYEILEHVEDCKICKQNIIDGYDVLKNTTEINIDKHPYFGSKKENSIKFKKTNYHVLSRIAASIVFIFSLGIIGFYVKNNKLETSDKISKNTQEKSIIKDSIDEKKSILKYSEDSVKNKDIIKDIEILEDENPVEDIKFNNLIAENILDGEEYQISPIMISMLGVNTRTDFFEVKYPKDSTIFENNQSITFIWDSDINEEIKLKVYNYKDELVFESNVLESNEFIMTKNLLPGAYIWKIEGHDDIYHLGLFFNIK